MISILVPVYNAAAFLEQCIDSILSQTYENIELILADDGSIDGSKDICDRYAAIDARVTVVALPHGGAAAARKAAFKVSSGEWIGFVDSDDWIDPGMYGKLHKEAMKTGAEIVLAGHMDVFPDKMEQWTNGVPEGFYSRGEMCEKIFPCLKPEAKSQRWLVGTACWDKLYKREVLDHPLKAVDDRIWDGDDIAFVYPTILAANGVSVMQELLYYHRVRTKSLSTAYDDCAFERLGILYHVLKNSYSAHAEWEKLKKLMAFQIRWFLLRHLYLELETDIYEENNAVRPYIFPFGSVQENDRIILYGSGLVGKLFVRQLRKAEYGRLVLWVSQDYEEGGGDVSPPEMIKECEYDAVVIAVADADVADEIKSELQKMNVPMEKVIWKDPLY